MIITYYHHYPDANFQALSFNPFTGALSLEMDVLVDVYVSTVDADSSSSSYPYSHDLISLPHTQNPNHLPAFLTNATLDIYRVVEPGHEKHGGGEEAAPAFGVATALGHQVPRRGVFDLNSHISIVSMPFKVALSLLNEILRHRGMIKVRGIGTAYISAMRQDIAILVDCVQHVTVIPFPGRIDYSQCDFRISNQFINDYSESIAKLQPYVESGE